jgi:hypothetical protein
MYSLFSKATNVRLLLISFCVYLFVNLFENLIHYNIGRNSDSEIKFDTPTKKDWIKIVFVMFFFAFLQGILTCMFDERCT